MEQPSLLMEQFSGSAFDPRLQWLNPPPSWELRGEALHVVPAARTDFWQRTHYGFQADSGHLLFLDTPADFTCTTEVSFQAIHQYDQAGLMVRVSPEDWLKTSIEYEPDGPWRLGAVVTNGGFSDWSTQDVPPGTNAIRLRVDRHGHDFTVYAQYPGDSGWMQIRLCRLHEAAAGRRVSVGLYACCPTDAGLRAEFKHLQVRAQD